MAASLRILIADDFEPFRRFVAQIVRNRPDAQVICDVSDGLEAVRKAKQLQPDVIFLDIGLPELNGIEAARQIRELSPASKILFVSMFSGPEIVREALAAGASAYVIKTDAGAEILRALDAALRGQQFLSSGLAGSVFEDRLDRRSPSDGSSSPAGLRQLPGRHEVGFYSGDESVLEHVAEFAGVALEKGHVAILVMTEPHRKALPSRLQAHGIGPRAASEQGRYIVIDAAETLSAFMRDGRPDPARFRECLGDLILSASKASGESPARVALFGECVHLLWAQGNAEAAIQLEKLGNELMALYDLDILCGYSVGGVHGPMDSHIYQQICAEHSLAHSR